MAEMSAARPCGMGSESEGEEEQRGATEVSVDVASQSLELTHMLDGENHGGVFMGDAEEGQGAMSEQNLPTTDETAVDLESTFIGGPK